jgi:hypothetical protein
VVKFPFQHFRFQLFSFSAFRSLVRPLTSDLRPPFSISAFQRFSFFPSGPVLPSSRNPVVRPRSHPSAPQLHRSDILVEPAPINNTPAPEERYRSPPSVSSVPFVPLLPRISHFPISQFLLFPPSRCPVVLPFQHFSISAFQLFPVGSRGPVVRIPDFPPLSSLRSSLFAFPHFSFLHVLAPIFLPARPGPRVSAFHFRIPAPDQLRRSGIFVAARPHAPASSSVGAA